jgi:hypothetical protein
LKLGGAVCLRALQPDQIQAYLVKVGRSDLWQILSQDEELKVLAETPLFLSTMIWAYPVESLGQWRQLDSPQEQLQDLWDRYIYRMFDRELHNQPYGKRKPPSQKQSRLWLIWLAQQMQRESQTEFLIERMQPTLLQNPQQRRTYGAISACLISPTLMFISWLFNSDLGSDLGLIYASLPCLIAVPIFVFSPHNEEIKPLEALRWSSVEFCKNWISGIKLYVKPGIAFSPLAALSFFFSTDWQTPIIGVFLSCISGLAATLFFYIFFCLILGIPSALITTLRSDKLIERLESNQGIKRAIQNSIIVVLIVWFTSSLSLLLSVKLLFQLPEAETTFISSFSSYSGIGLAILKAGLGIGFISSMTLGWATLVQHFALRLTLFRSKHIPWNYAQFLDYATDRRILQRVGGQYRFMHKLLQDHFAEMVVMESDR